MIFLLKLVFILLVSILLYITYLNGIRDSRDGEKRNLNMVYVVIVFFYTYYLHSHIYKKNKPIKIVYDKNIKDTLDCKNVKEYNDYILIKVN